MNFSSYFLLGPEPGDQMLGTYNMWLVILSYLVSSFAAYTAIDISSIIKSNREKNGKIPRGWLMGGAFAMGSGVFTMHFVAMLAFTLPIPVFYNVWITLLSLLPAVLMAGFVLTVMSVEKMGNGKLVFSALMMAIGIGTMHYTGMFAMRGDMIMLYSPWLFALSIIVAKILSFLSLTIMSHFIHNRTEKVMEYKVASAMVMGAAICGMHYTGMAATNFYPGNMAIGTVLGLDTALLAGVVALVSMSIISINLVLSTISQRKFIELEKEISERKLAEKALKDARNHLEIRVRERTAELQDLHDEKNRFISRASHDMRTPIAAILGFSKLLPEGKWGELNEKQRECVEKIEGHADRLSKIVADLLSISRIESGVIGIAKDEVRISNEIKLVALEMEELLKSKKQKLVVKNDGNSTIIVGNRDSIHQVLTNLVDNASKYSDKKKTITIDATQVNGDLCVNVKDEGIGLTEEDQHHIYEEFYRAKNSGELKAQGTGLGLAIVKKLVDQMGGAVRVQSDGPGTGSTFSFSLPIVK